MTTAVTHPVNTFVSDLACELSLQLGDRFIVHEQQSSDLFPVDEWTIGHVTISDGTHEDWRAIPRMWMNMTPAGAASKLLVDLGYK